MRGSFGRRGESVGVDPTTENIDLFGEGENPYAAAVDAGHHMEPRARKIFLMCVALVAIYVVGLIIPKDMLDFDRIQSVSNTVSGGYTLSWFVEDIQNNITSIIGVLTGDKLAAQAFIPDSLVGTSEFGYESTMIRYVVIAIAGAGLALSGAIYQGSFSNALVSPSTLGVMTGGQFGMMIWVVMAGTIGGGSISLGVISTGMEGETTAWDYLNSSYGLAAMSFLGCFLVVGLVLLTMRIAGARQLSGVMMILTGQVIGGVIGVIRTCVNYYYVTTDPWGEIAQNLQELQVASFYRTFTWIDIVAIGVPLIITFIVVMRLRQRMMVLSFEATESRSMGVDARVMQVIVVGLCTLLTAIIISFCGTIGFVGFMVPHLARRMVGPNFRYLLPASTVLGAIFVLSAYIVVEATLGDNYTSMVGTYVSILGSVIFVVTLIRGRGAPNGAFLR